MSLPLNPYEPSHVSIAADARVVKSRIAPRDLVDFLIVLIVFSFSVGLGLALCAFAMFLCRLTFVPEVVGLGLLLLPLFIILRLITPFAIRKLSVDPAGLILHRGGHGPQFIDWHDVVGISTVSRGEYIRRNLSGPQHTCWTCFSSRDQCRIDWAGGRFYFPPRDVEAFVELVESRIQSGREGSSQDQEDGDHDGDSP